MKDLKSIMRWSVATMVITVIHHFHGAYIYAEPFRLHVVFIAVPVKGIIAGSYFGVLLVQHEKWRDVFRTVFIGTTLIFSIIAIGLYEGGYNHAVKNLLYFSGVPATFLDRIYPSVYELPNDFIFEFTGVAQLVAGLICARFLLRHRKANHTS